MPVFEIKDTGISMHLEFDRRADFARDNTTQEELAELINRASPERQIILSINGNPHTVAAAAISRRIRGALVR